MTLLVIYLIGVVLSYTIDKITSYDEETIIGSKIARLLVSLSSWVILGALGLVYLFTLLRSLIPERIFNKEVPKWLRWF